MLPRIKSAGPSVSVKFELVEAEKKKGRGIAAAKAKALQNKMIAESMFDGEKTEDEHVQAAPTQTNASTCGHLFTNPNMKEECDPDAEFCPTDTFFNTWAPTQPIGKGLVQSIPRELSEAKLDDAFEALDNSPLSCSLGKTRALLSNASTPLQPIHVKRPVTEDNFFKYPLDIWGIHANSSHIKCYIFTL